MSNFYELVAQGGPVMIPMMGLSVVTIACGFERAWFWSKVFQGESRISARILDAADHSLSEARSLAESAKDMPIGRFLLAGLKLHQPAPDTFSLAMEAAGEKEFAQMRKGDKLLETTIAIAPLLGLLGTVTGLMTTFSNLNVGAGGGSPDLTKAAAGIGEALTSTAGGMIVAIVALVIFRTSVSLQAQQVDYFAEVGSALDLIYRQKWKPSESPQTQNTGDPGTHLDANSGAKS
jgi:biopolymer transport protein ExbB